MCLNTYYLDAKVDSRILAMTLKPSLSPSAPKDSVLSRSPNASPKRRFCAPLALVATLCFALVAPAIQAEEGKRVVVAFWNFPTEDDFPLDDAPVHYWNFEPSTGIRSEASLLTAFIGKLMNNTNPNLDPNGGKGMEYTSTVTGTHYAESRSLHFEDLNGKGDLFEIDGSTTALQDRGLGTEERDFSNDALLYIQLDGSELEDFRLRFDVNVDKSTPAESFDLFFRTTGEGGIWYRDESYDNLSLNINPNTSDGTVAISLPAALDNEPYIELILNDFDEGEVANSDLEIDNLEITAVPEAGSALGAFTSALTLGFLRNRRTASGLNGQNQPIVGTADVLKAEASPAANSETPTPATTE